jgi:hypothetical protein
MKHSYFWLGPVDVALLSWLIRKICLYVLYGIEHLHCDNHSLFIYLFICLLLQSYLLQYIWLVLIDPRYHKTVKSCKDQNIVYV